jgi:hypothetical protein
MDDHRRNRELSSEVPLSEPVRKYRSFSIITSLSYLFVNIMRTDALAGRLPNNAEFQAPSPKKMPTPPVVSFTN